MIPYEADGARYTQSGTDYGVARVLYEGKSKAGDYRALGFLSALTRHAEQDTQAHGLDYTTLPHRANGKLTDNFCFQVRISVRTVSVVSLIFAEISAKAVACIWVIRTTTKNSISMIWVFKAQRFAWQ